MKLKYLSIILSALSILSACVDDSIDTNHPPVKQEDKSSSNKDDNKNEDKNNDEQKRPSDYTIATRLNVKWKENSNYQSEFDFDTLYNKKDKSKFTTEYLSQFVDFSSSSVEGNFFTLNSEETKKIKILDIKVEKNSNPNSKIILTISYNGVNGKTNEREKPSLTFDQDTYYSSFFTVDNSFAKTHYLEGISEHISAFYQHFLKYDENRFTVVFKDSYTDRGNNSIRIKALILNKNYKEEYEKLASFDYNVSGFKNLSNVKNDIEISSSYELDKYFTERVKKYKLQDGNVLNQLKNISIYGWIYKAQIYRLYSDKRRIKMELSEEYSNNSTNKILQASTNRVYDADLRLINPYWELKSAEKIGNKLNLIVTLGFANEEFINIDFPISITLLQQ